MDTFIAGLSMGGYGAIRNGLKYHDTFSYVGGLSSAMIIDGIEERANDNPMFIERRDFAESIFGDLSKVKMSDKNPEWLLNKLCEEKVELPKMYLARGMEDSLLGVNQRMRDYMISAGLNGNIRMNLSE